MGCKENISKIYLFLSFVLSLIVRILASSLSKNSLFIQKKTDRRLIFIDRIIILFKNYINIIIFCSCKIWTIGLITFAILATERIDPQDYAHHIIQGI